MPINYTSVHCVCKYLMPKVFQNAALMRYLAILHEMQAQTLYITADFMG